MKTIMNVSAITATTAWIYAFCLFSINAITGCQNNPVEPTPFDDEDANARLATVAKTSEKFSVTNGSEGGEYITAVNFRIWYQDTEPEQQLLDELYNDASNANSQYLPTKKPNQTAKVAARIGAGGYTKKKYFTKSLTVEKWALLEVTFPDGIAKVGRNRYNALFWKIKADAVKDINKIIVADAFRAGIN